MVKSKESTDDIEDENEVIDEEEEGGDVDEDIDGMNFFKLQRN